VNIRFKLVALVLLLGLLASPAVAMAGCWSYGSANPGQPCEPHCPKMAAMMDTMAETAPSSIGASAPMSACCSVSPSRPESALQLTGSQSSSTIIELSVQVCLNLVTRPVAIQLSAAPPPMLAPSQTLLCTFLI
jgi:hypothetical protein